MIERNKIYLQDCVEGLKHIDSESADVVLIDPPYNIGKDFGNDSDKKTLDDYVKWSYKWMTEAFRIVKSQGSIYIYGFSEILAHLLVHNVSDEINRRWLVWHYTNKNVPNLNEWQRSHESILLLWKDDKRVFNVDAVREPYIGDVSKINGTIRPAVDGRFGSKETTYTYHEKGAQPRDVIKIPALAGWAGMTERWFLCKTCNDVYHPKEIKKHKKHKIIKHPTQKPLKLSEKLLTAAMPINSSYTPLVVIPFGGSGSECVVAKQLGYDYITFELNSNFVDLSRRWLKYSEIDEVENSFF